MWGHLQCNPDLRELSGPEKKSLISRFGLFCLNKCGDTSYNAFYVQNTSLFNSYRHKKHKNQYKIDFQSVFTNNSVKNYFFLKKSVILDCTEISLLTS